jgi:prepilin-type N-terminal cleavage/methylation domain-containing protein
MNHKGFTLIELLLVVALVGVLGYISIGFYSRFFTQNAVANTTDQLTSELRKAQIYSMMGKQNSSWGVHKGTNQIILFQGSSYTGRNVAFDEIFSVNQNVSLTGLSDIIFSRMTGTPSASPTIVISGNNNTKTVIVNSQGVVSR